MIIYILYSRSLIQRDLYLYCIKFNKSKLYTYYRALRSSRDSSITFLFKDQIKLKSISKLIFLNYRTTCTCKADKTHI